MFVQPTEVYFRWRVMPCFQQNGPITGYVVRYYLTCGTGRNVQQNKSVVTTGGIIDGLTPNTEYAFQAAAVNVNGTGPFSEPITLGGKLHVAWIFFPIISHNTVTYLLLYPFYLYRSPTVGDGHSSELYYCKCLLE